MFNDIFGQIGPIEVCLMTKRKVNVF